MTGSDKRLTIALAGLLAGLIAGLLSVVVPPSVSQLDSPFISALFGEVRCLETFFLLPAFLGLFSAFTSGSFPAADLSLDR